MKKWLPILLILWLAFGLRVYDLTAVPPGLTHDEANHGREAIGILDGVLLYYFPLNYGSEPLYSYTTAGTIGLLGESLFALRFVNIIFSLLAIAATYAWVKPAFDKRVGLLTAVLLATSFWPLASSRQALRAGMLPFFMALAVWTFWQFAEGQGSRGAEEPKLPITDNRLLITLFAILIAITFHIYLAARVAWLIFPAFIIYLAIVNRAKFRQLWWPTLLGLLLAALLVTPMFVYLQNHPEAQTRLGMFRDPLGAVVSSNIGPILQRAGKAFLAFFWPGSGDQFLAYNIPGRPAFDAITGIFFLVGLGVVIKFTIYDLRFTILRPPSPPVSRPSLHPAHTFLLLWFLIGIIPSLITGPTANTTRNLAALSAVHILPAVGFVTIIDKVKPYLLRHTPYSVPAQNVRYDRELPSTKATNDTKQAKYSVPFVSFVDNLAASPLYAIRNLNYLSIFIALLWFTFTLVTTSRDYFVRWGQSPEVRSAYQYTLIEELAYAQERPSPNPLIISTVYPGPAHDSSIAMLLTPDRDMRWVDARLGLIVPDGRFSQFIIPQSTPPHPLFAQWLQASDHITLRSDDLDPSFTIYQLDSTELQNWLDQPNMDINFNGAITLRQARWLAETAPPGGVAELLTVWQVTDPSRMGPRVLPADATDAKLFTHVLADDESIIAQQDLLSVPSWQWQTDDVILQVHQIWIAPEIEAGVYETAVGFYSETTSERVPIIGSTDNRAFVTSLQIAP